MDLLLCKNRDPLLRRDRRLEGDGYILLLLLCKGIMRMLLTDVPVPRCSAQNSGWQRLSKSMWAVDSCCRLLVVYWHIHLLRLELLLQLLW